jgi:uncharacterized protein YacL (UPF0231 family)
MSTVSDKEMREQLRRQKLQQTVCKLATPSVKVEDEKKRLKREAAEAKRAQDRELSEAVRLQSITTGEATLIDRTFYDNITAKNEREKELLLLKLQEERVQHAKEVMDLKMKNAIDVHTAIEKAAKKQILMDESMPVGAGGIVMVADVGQKHNSSLIPIRSEQEIAQLEDENFAVTGLASRYCLTLRNLAQEKKYVVNKLDHYSTQDQREHKLIAHEYFLVQQPKFSRVKFEQQVVYPGHPFLEKNPLYTEEEMQALYTVEQRLQLMQAYTEATRFAIQNKRFSSPTDFSTEESLAKRLKVA